MTEKSLLFGNGRYELQYDPNNPDGVFSLERLDLGEGDDETLGMWQRDSEVLFELDHYWPEITGEKRSLADKEWQKFYGWMEEVVEKLHEK